MMQKAFILFVFMISSNLSGKAQIKNDTTKHSQTKPNQNPDTTVFNKLSKPTHSYVFAGELPAAKINALIKVSPEGDGSFIALAKGSTSQNELYTNAIKKYLPNVKFNKADHESTIVVTFNFYSK